MIWLLLKYFNQFLYQCIIKTSYNFNISFNEHITLVV